MKIGKAKKVPRIVVFGSVAVAILAALYVIVGRPTILYLKRAQAEFRSKQAKIQESQELIRSLPNPAKAIEELENKAREFKDLNLNKKQLPRIVQLLGESATQRKISVVSIRPREDIKGDSESLPTGVTKIYVEMVVACSYQELADYVKALIELPVSFTVESLTIDTMAQEQKPKVPDKKAAAAMPLQAAILLSTYTVWEF